MARMQEIHCATCGETKNEMRNFHDYFDDICMNCYEKKAKAAKNDWLLRISSYPIEERIAAIESYIYDNNMNTKFLLGVTR
jgi:recombinational DNA repair protein (RecF pathway)